MAPSEAALAGHQRGGAAGARLDADARWRCSCRCCCSRASRKKLFAPLALTVAVAMIAVVLRQHVRDAGGVPLLPRPRRARAGFGKRVERGHRRASPTATRALLRARAAVPRHRHRRARSCWSWRQRLGRRRGCRARSSPRSTSRWSASTCASRPGTSLAGGVAHDRRDGQARSAQELPQGQRRAGARQRRLARTTRAAR